MSNPFLVQVPFCNSGTNRNTIQVTRQPTQAEQDATYFEGFPGVTMVPTGGIAPNGQDMNGILYELSSPIAHYCRGDRIQFDDTYAAAIGGYPLGAILASNDYQRDYISLVDNNLADPNGTNTTWAIYSGQGSVPVATSTTNGTVKLVNSLASNATDAALTAAQGKALNDVFNKFSFVNASTGWLEIPVGNRIFIAQWGITPDILASSQTVITFPKGFSTACYNVQLTHRGVNDRAPIAKNLSRFSFVAQNYDTIETVSYFWLAIGE